MLLVEKIPGYRILLREQNSWSSPYLADTANGVGRAAHDSVAQGSGRALARGAAIGPPF